MEKNKPEKNKSYESSIVDIIHESITDRIKERKDQRYHEIYKYLLEKFNTIDNWTDQYMITVTFEDFKIQNLTEADINEVLIKYFVSEFRHIKLSKYQQIAGTFKIVDNNTDDYDPT